MTNFRIFVEKKPNFNVEARQLLADFKQNLQLASLRQLRLINIYDIFNISYQELMLVQNTVLSEVQVDTVSGEFDWASLALGCWFAVEPLPGQYDQRSDSALQAFNLLAITNPQLMITTGKLIITNQDILASELDKIKDYYINPLEYRSKSLDLLAADVLASSTEQIPIHAGFIDYPPPELENFRNAQALAMSSADILCIQDYFKHQEQRDPSETEIKVLDTYWSDHCRHTTFETQLTTIQFAADKYRRLLQNTFSDYLASRDYVYADNIVHKPITLMDLATICARRLKKAGELKDLELSDEINACSLLVAIDVDNQPQQWALQFKNETHNHPTEIEPYGGASTCVGGAIRDPLSGRAYVYQALRISGGANPLEAVADTLPGKLPQKKITTKAAQGFSSYGNQIGLATTLVREIYHPGYKAKHMEVGMVVAAAPYANIKRSKPDPGDVIILLGGRTGRDGCGGATGSSKGHDLNSAAVCGAQVQKGNPVIERKIQRLFRNPQATQLIKKCNDFGAGGICVAIGELADGILIDLDYVPTKYHGLTGTELALSESQERMAVVVANTDAAKFIQLAGSENLEATIVAKVTGDARMVMIWGGRVIVDLAREFLNTNGAKARAQVMVEIADTNKSLFDGDYPGSNFGERTKSLLADLNICSQQGLVDMFDSTIGASTVLLPFGGKYQLTPVQVSVQKFPLLSGTTDAASIVSYGYDPYLTSQSTFHGAYYAVIDSVAKIVASGADYRKIRFSFQEYFEKLGNDPVKWGKPFGALLGAYKAQQQLQLAAIGGKDSMSGSFNELHVPPTLISFAVAPTLASAIISPEFKAPANYVYAYIPKYLPDDIVDTDNLIASYQLIRYLIHTQEVNAALAIGAGGILEAVLKMSFGNKIGIKITTLLDEDELFKRYYGGIVFASPGLIDNSAFNLIGQTVAAATVSGCGTTLTLEELIHIWQAKLAPVFPLTASAANANFAQDFNYKRSSALPASMKSAASTIGKPRVLIPVFPGTNCEYDVKRAFDLAGGATEMLVFNNLSPAAINESIKELSRQINQAQILMLPGGFSAGDEPDGSAKFIAAILRNGRIQDSVSQLLAKDGLILGICNGFQALIKSGLLPYGEICDLTEDSPTLTYNALGRHISRLVRVKVVNNQSPWLSSCVADSICQVAASHGEGRLVCSPEVASTMAARGQIASVYVNPEGVPTMDGLYNPNGSDYAIEGLMALNGRIFGRMGHFERKGADLYKNINSAGTGEVIQDIFANGINYFN